MKKKRKPKKKNYLVIILFILIVIFLMFLLIENVIKARGSTGYEKVSHVSDVKDSVKNNDTDNYKTLGWVDVFNTSIDMPIFDIKNDYEGSVNVNKFSWTRDDGKFHNFMTIYGHNIMNLGVPQMKNKDFNRFEELMDYVYEDFANNHKYFQITIDGKDYVYKIFSVSILGAYDVDTFPNSGASNKKLNYILNMLNKESIYKYNVDVNNKDSIAVLTTCTRMFSSKNKGYYDIAVAGRLVRDGESINNYSLKKTDKYKNIDEVINNES